MASKFYKKLASVPSGVWTLGFVSLFMDISSEMIHSLLPISWLAGDHISIADLSAAAHISCIDYLGDVPWENHTSAKDWYARIKSRPSFRPLLSDQIRGLNPVSHYADLDF